VIGVAAAAGWAGIELDPHTAHREPRAIEASAVPIITKDLRAMTIVWAIDESPTTGRGADEDKLQAISAG
jgi:hypothetical protein